MKKEDVLEKKGAAEGLRPEGSLYRNPYLIATLYKSGVLAQLRMRTGPIVTESRNRNRGSTRLIARTIIVVLLSSYPIGGYIAMAIYVYLYNKFKYIYNYSNPYSPVLNSGAIKRILLFLIGIVLFFKSRGTTGLFVKTYFTYFLPLKSFNYIRLINIKFTFVRIIFLIIFY